MTSARDASDAANVGLEHAPGKISSQGPLAWRSGAQTDGQRDVDTKNAGARTGGSTLDVPGNT
jgi:hypothetical protein